MQRWKSEKILLRCPNSGCQNHKVPRSYFCRRKGYFVTKWNYQPVRRYLCIDCGTTFSSHTFRRTYRQHRPDLNKTVFDLYASGMTQRRMAIVLGVNRKTIVRKILFVAQLCKEEHKRQSENGKLSADSVQFDEMVTFEHTRLKPVTIALAVQSKTGKIIAANAKPIAYQGPLSSIAFAKYGPRKDESAIAIQTVLDALKLSCPKLTLVITDASPKYPRRISKALPEIQHRKCVSRINEGNADRKNYNDPLFTLNYTCAKVRADLSRMSRKTWVTTKKISRLQAHLDLYIAWNNGYQISV